MYASWKASLPIADVGTCPVMATIGVESIKAFCSGVIRLVAPGPEVTITTPTSPVAWAKPSAMCPAPCSCRASTCLIGLSRRGS